MLLVDEAYQADSAKYFAVGSLAPVHLLVGDAGQINPFATVADPGRWRGLPEDPLSSLPEADEFHLDPGRMCVLLTRHRQACVVVGRAGDRDNLHDRPPPPTAAYLGWDPDPMLDGWEVHQEVLATLEAYRLAV